MAQKRNRKNEEVLSGLILITLISVILGIAIFFIMIGSESTLYSSIGFSMLCSLFAWVILGTIMFSK